MFLHCSTKKNSACVTGQIISQQQEFYQGFWSRIPPMVLMNNHKPDLNCTSDVVGMIFQFLLQFTLRKKKPYLKDGVYVFLISGIFRNH